MLSTVSNFPSILNTDDNTLYLVSRKQLENCWTPVIHSLLYQDTLGAVAAECILVPECLWTLWSSKPVFFFFFSRNVLVLSSNYSTYHCYADDTQPNLSFPSGSTQCAVFICVCHVDISVWMPAHHLKLSLDKPELKAVAALWKISPS